MERIYYMIESDISGQGGVTAYDDLWDVAQDVITDDLMNQYYKGRPFTAGQKEYHLGKCHTHLKRDMLNAQESVTYYVDSSLGKTIAIYWMRQD